MKQIFCSKDVIKDFHKETNQWHVVDENRETVNKEDICRDTVDIE